MKKLRKFRVRPARMNIRSDGDAEGAVRQTHT
jgi:hypothetical protein